MDISLNLVGGLDLTGPVQSLAQRGHWLDVSAWGLGHLATVDSSPATLGTAATMPVAATARKLGHFPALG